MLKLFKTLPRAIKLKFLLACFLTFIGVFLSLTMPNFIAQFIKLIFNNEPKQSIEIIAGVNIFENADRNYIQNWLIIIITVQTILTALVSFASVFMFVWAAEQSSFFFRRSLYDKLNALSLKNLADLKPESIMTRISNDVATFWDFLVSGLRMIVKGTMLIVGGVILSLLVNWKMALVILPTIPILIIVMLVIAKFASPLIKKSKLQLEDVTKEIEENVNGARTIKTYNLETQRTQKFSQTNSFWYKLNTKFATVVTLLFPIFFATVHFVVIGIYMFTRHQIISQVATDNTVVQMNIFIDYLWLIAFGIMLVTSFLRFAFVARVSAKRITEVLDIKQDELFVEHGVKIKDLVESNPNLNYDLEFKNLNFKYYHENPNYALKDINLKVPFGTKLGIIGLFASGKSTLVSLVLNNYLYNEGSITLANQEINKINTNQLLQTVSIVYQNAMLYSGTIRSNMLWAKPDASDEEIYSALKAACAYDFVNKFDDKLDHKITEGATNLSGGQKQRISIARTLLRKPKILILDDSTSALDNITTKKVLKNIKNDFECTTILISQKIGSLKDCDNIIVMQSGKIIAQGTHKFLLKNNEFYAQIHHNQFDL